MHETEGKLTFRLIPTSKGLYTGLVYREDSWPDLTLKWCSNRGETTLHQDGKMTTSEVDGLPKMLDLIHMIIYNVFLTSWTFAYKSNLFYHGHETAAAAKLLQSCPTLCDPIDDSPPGSPVPGILQARTLEWVAISFSNAWKWKVKVKSLTRVQLLATPWTAAY